MKSQNNLAENTNSNIVSIRAFRTLRECKKLFKGYQTKLLGLNKSELLGELDRYRVEANRYPSHLLTIVKGEILMQVVSARSLTSEMKEFAAREEKRLKFEVERRLTEIH